MLGSMNHQQYHSLPHQSPPCNFGPYTPREELPWGTLQPSAPLSLHFHSSVPQIGPASVPLQWSQVGLCCLTPWWRPPLLGRSPKPCPAWEPTLLHCWQGHRPGCCSQEQPPGHAHFIRLANTELHGGQHLTQLHHPSWYVAQVPTAAWGVGCCRGCGQTSSSQAFLVGRC